MSEPYEIVSVNAENVEKLGFFCYKSKKKSDGYRRKLAWLQQRFAEGLRIEIVYENGRSVGFIEYTPGEYAWRAVHAPNTLFIHCLWVVGKGKGKGYGSRLLALSLEEARRQGKNGVAMTTSSRVWLADNRLLLNHGFTAVDNLEPFDLLYYPLNGGPSPSFPTDWAARMARYDEGLTVLRTNQCPYVEDAVGAVLSAADELGIEARAVELTSAAQVQAESPTPYGIFGILYEGRLLSYHYLLKKDLVSMLKT